MESKKSSNLGSDKDLIKVEKKEKKEETAIQRSRRKSRTIIDKDFSSFSSNFKYREYLDQNANFCDYMEDCALSINNFNKESYRHLFVFLMVMGEM